MHTAHVWSSFESHICPLLDIELLRLNKSIVRFLLLRVSVARFLATMNCLASMQDAKSHHCGLKMKSFSFIHGGGFFYVHAQFFFNFQNRSSSIVRFKCSIISLLFYLVRKTKKEEMLHFNVLFIFFSFFFAFYPPLFSYFDSQKSISGEC